MKKLLAIITGLLLTCTAFLTGCSCSPTTNQLEFNNLALVSEGIQKNDHTTKETHTYSVNLNTDYNSNMKIDEYFSNGDVSINPANFNGTYVIDYSFTPYTATTLQAETNTNLKNSSVLNSLLNADNSTVNVYSYTATLNLNVNYEFKGDPVEGSSATDRIVNTVYFAGKDNLYIPIYSKIESRCNHLAYQDSKFGILSVYYDAETVYSNGSYTCKTTYYNKLGEQTSTNTFKASYEKGKVYDATQLLFVMRNVVVPSNSYQIVSFASLAYNTPTEIRFDHKGQTVYAPGFDFNVNTTQGTFSANTGADVPVNKLNYYVNDVNMTGVSQELYIQRADAGEVKNRGYLVKYVAPLMTYGGTSMMLGGLEYNLQSVSITNK